MSSQRTKTKALKIVVSVSAVITVLLLFAWDAKIRYHARLNENYFLSIHSMIESYRADNDQYPTSMSDVIALYPDSMRMLLKRFPSGLNYRVVRDGYELAEPKVYRVSMVSADRLIYDSVGGGRWEESREPLQKRGRLLFVY